VSICNFIGAGLWRPQAAEERALDFKYEGVWRFGSFGADGIRAWTFASDTGYSFPNVPLKPRISVKANISSAKSGYSTVTRHWTLIIDSATPRLERLASHGGPESRRRTQRPSAYNPTGK
jgi:hypothetical protein